MIFKRGNLWHYKLQVDGRLYRGSTKQTGKKKAEQYEQVLIGRIKDGDTIQVKDKSPFLREYLDTFAEYTLARNGMADKTKEYYKAGIDFLRTQPIADVRIHMIRTSDIETISFPKDYSGSTINRVYRTLKRALNLAVEKDLIHKCPKIKLVEEHQRKQTISSEMEEILMEDLPPSGKLGLKIILDCGCRPAEVAALDVERHLDFERMTILVEKGKTHKSSRFVPMSDRVRDGIVEHLNGRTKGWLFPSNRIEGEHLQRQSFTQAFAAVRRARKLPKGTVLDLARHTFATDIMEETGNVFVAKELMGHSSTATLGRYQHPKLAGMAAAINARNIRNAEKNNSEKVTIKSQFTNCPESDAK